MPSKEIMYFATNDVAKALDGSDDALERARELYEDSGGEILEYEFSNDQLNAFWSGVEAAGGTEYVSNVSKAEAEFITGEVDEVPTRKGRTD